MPPHPPSPHHTSPRHTSARLPSFSTMARGSLAAGLGLLFVGCAQSHSGSSAVNSGLESLGSEWAGFDAGLADLDPGSGLSVSANEQAAELKKTMRNLEDLYADFGTDLLDNSTPAPIIEPLGAQTKGAATDGQPLEEDAEQPAQDKPTGETTLADDSADVPTDPSDTTPTQDQETETAVVEPELDTLIDEAAKALAALLRERATDTTDPLGAYVALEALGGAWPGALEDVGTQSHLKDLAPDELEVLKAFREIIRTLGNDEALSAEMVADLLDRVGADLRSHLPIRITDAILCTRVTGFGQYTPMAGNGMLAGRDNTVIVYIAVDRFAHQALMGSGVSVSDGGANRWSVELAQELKLYKDATVVWSDPSQMIVDTCRVKREDFYLVQQITLPRTLSVGEYDLKVTIRDRITGSEAQRTIPIRLVVASHLLISPG